MKVKQILSNKGSAVITASPRITIQDAARELKKHRIGALVITDEDGAVRGIVSERDIVNAVADLGEECRTLPVERIMTREVQTCTMEDTTDRLMEIMTEKRMRHLPVVHEGQLVGIVSIGDVVKSRIEEIAFEAEQMKMYIGS